MTHNGSGVSPLKNDKEINEINQKYRTIENVFLVNVVRTIMRSSRNFQVEVIRKKTKRGQRMHRLSMKHFG